MPVQEKPPAMPGDIYLWLDLYDLLKKTPGFIGDLKYSC
jgi:hypothetical protein